MAYLGKCYACVAGDHGGHTKAFDSPPPDTFICGGGICICEKCEPQFKHLSNQ